MEDVVSTSGASESSNFSSLVDSAFDSPATVDATEEATEETQVVDQESPEESVDTEVAEETDDTVEPEPEEVEQPKAEEAEEGVSVRERNGRKEYVLKEGRYQTVYSGYKTSQEAERIIGEPITADAIQSRHDAFIDREAMIADFFSGEPSSEVRVFEFFDSIANQARKNGEVGHDPMVNFAARAAEYLKNRPDAYDAMGAPYLKDVIESLKGDARKRALANKDDNSLLLSLQHIEHALYGNFTPEEKIMAVPSSLDERERQIQEREQKIQQAERGRRADEWKSYNAEVTKSIKTSIATAIDDRLKDIAPSYENFPEDFTAIKNDLHNNFRESLKNDAAWQSYLKNQTRKAQLAVAPSARAAVQKDLEARYKAKADYFLDPQRNESVRNILSRRAAQMKANSDANHKRMATAAAKREPNSPGGVVNQNAKRLAPNGSGSQAFKDFVSSAF